MLTIAGWLIALPLLGLFALLLVQAGSCRRHRDRANAHHSMVAACTVLCVSAAVLGIAGLSLLLVVPLAVLAAMATGYLLWLDVRDPKSKRTMRDAIGDAWTALRMALMNVRQRASRNQAAPDGKPALALVPDAPAPERRRDAPAPALPAADGPASAGPRLAIAGNIPPDHAAAHQRIASFEPEGLTAFIHFLTSEARGLTGYGDAFGTCMDNLIFGPGVPPEALKAGFDFADMFAEVAAMANMTAKRVLDYFAGHLEWAESHDPTKDGHWTIRE